MIWPFENFKDPELLIKDLESSDPLIRENAFSQLKRHTHQQADESILNLLQGDKLPEKKVLMPLVVLAGHRKINESIKVLKTLARRPDSELRESALQALVSIDTEDSLDELVSLLLSEEDDIKSKARNCILSNYGEEALGSLLRAVPEDKSSSNYFEIVSVMEELSLFDILKDNFSHPDLIVRSYCFDNIRKFHRPDFVPLIIDYYKQAPTEKKEQIIETLLEYSVSELLGHFKAELDYEISESTFHLSKKVIFNRFSSNKQEILKFAKGLPHGKYKAVIISDLIKKLDPYIVSDAFSLLCDPVSEVRVNASKAITEIFKKTFKRITSNSEPSKGTLSRLYDSWEKHLSLMLEEKIPDSDIKKTIRRVFFVLASNRHSMLKPFLIKFCHENFQETYSLIKNWSFTEQFNIFKDGVQQDPSLAAMLLGAAKATSDNNLLRIILKLANYLEDEQDQKAFIRKIVSGSQKISIEQFFTDTDPEIRKTTIEITVETDINKNVDKLLMLINDPSAIVRLAAVKALVSARYSKIDKVLKEFLTDPEQEIAFYSLTELKKINPKMNTSAYLINFINSKSDKIRKFALDEIAKISREKYISNFQNLTPETRKMAAKVIQKIDHSFADKIIQDLSAIEPETRLKAALLLENIQIDETGKKSLILAMKDPSRHVRSAVVKTLGVVGDSEMIKKLIYCFDDPDIRVRANTVEAISSLGDRQAIQLLLPYLEDSNNRIRANAIVGIRKFGNVNVTPVLQNMLNDSNEKMVASALWAMGELKDANYLNYLYDYLTNSNEMLRHNAVKSIVKISPDALRSWLPLLKNDPNPQIRKLTKSIR